MAADNLWRNPEVLSAEEVPACGARQIGRGLEAFPLSKRTAPERVSALARSAVRATGLEATHEL